MKNLALWSLLPHHFCLLVFPAARMSWYISCLPQNTLGCLTILPARGTARRGGLRATLVRSPAPWTPTHTHTHTHTHTNEMTLLSPDQLSCLTPEPLASPFFLSLAKPMLLSYPLCHQYVMMSMSLLQRTNSAAQLSHHFYICVLSIVCISMSLPQNGLDLLYNMF